MNPDIPNHDPPTNEERAEHRGRWLVSALPQGRRELFIVQFFACPGDLVEINGDTHLSDGPLMRSLTALGAVWRKVDVWGTEVPR